ncbi:pseudouridine synthase [Candidatus Hodgkinia cicadicola]
MHLTALVKWQLAYANKPIGLECCHLLKFFSIKSTVNNLKITNRLDLETSGAVILCNKSKNFWSMPKSMIKLYYYLRTYNDNASFRRREVVWFKSKNVWKCNITYYLRVYGFNRCRLRLQLGMARLITGRKYQLRKQLSLDLGMINHFDWCLHNIYLQLRNMNRSVNIYNSIW